MEKGKIVVCAGESLVDVVAREIGVGLSRAETFVKKPGGAVANAAVGLSRLGVKTRFLGKVGTDPFGTFLKRDFEREGIEVARLTVSKDYSTGIVFVSLDEDRVPSFYFAGDPSEDKIFTEEEVSAADLEGASFLYLGTVSMVHPASRAATFKLIRLAAERDVKVFLDPNLRLHLWKDHPLLKRSALEAAGLSSLVKLNEIELEFLTGKKEVEAGARALLEQGPQVVVVTMGPKGAFFIGPGGTGYSPGFEVNAVDTTGAGDGFAAGLLSELNLIDWPPSGKDLERAARSANAVGAMVTMEVGARTALPTREEVDAFLKERGVS